MNEKIRQYLRNALLSQDITNIRANVLEAYEICLVMPEPKDIKLWTGNEYQEVTRDEFYAIKAFLRGGNSIQAIKWLREAHGFNEIEKCMILGLREAKDIVDTIKGMDYPTN